MGTLLKSIILLLTLSWCTMGAMMAGGWSEVKLPSENITCLSHFALAEMAAKSNSLYPQKIIEIQSAQKQVVSGMKYKITLKVGYTDCRKTAEDLDSSNCKKARAQNCAMNEEHVPEICTVTIWQQVWLNHTELLDSSCHQDDSAREKRHIAGKDNLDEDTMFFKNFIKTYKKTYKDEAEMKQRFAIFRQNLETIKLLRKYEQGTGEYGITYFTDLTKEEFKKSYLGYNPKLRKTEARGRAKIPDVAIPPAFDWRDHGAVTPVKDQKQCGSCWAFSVTGNVEGQWAIQRSKLLSLSEQELVDCDKLDQGCNGGFMENAYEQIIKLGGLETETDYPYEAEDEKCHFQKGKVQVTIESYVNISKDETQMAQWLYKNGPISIAINANAMQFYFGGISHPWKFLCSPKSLDHGVLIVGYGSSTYPLFNKTIPYWIVKNSWGPSWGEQGYYRVFRGDGTCGLNLDCTSAVV